MSQDRISACNVSALVGTEHLQAAPINLQGQSNAEQGSKQLRCGNKIGHNPSKIRFYSKPSTQKRRFHVLEEANRRVKDALDHPFDYPMFHGLMFHDNGRSIRSERLEAELAMLLPAIYDTLNLCTMQLGHFLDDGNFQHYCYKNLVARTGMSYWRVERNMRHLRDAGLITVQTVVVELNDGFKTERVIITASEQLFNMLHLDTRFLEDREKAMRNLTKLQNKWAARDKYLSLYRPHKVDNKSRKVDKDVVKGCQSIAKMKRPNYEPTYNPASDKQVIALAGELIKAQLCANMRDAITLACTKLGKSPPS
jgi:hypothetical protein